MASEQVKVSISRKEWNQAKDLAEKESFDTPTAYIRHLIRSKCRNAEA
jgi:hypothetical protein